MSRQTIPDLLPGTSGRRQLAVEASDWERMSTAIDRVIEVCLSHEDLLL